MSVKISDIQYKYIKKIKKGDKIIVYGFGGEYSITVRLINF